MVKLRPASDIIDKLVMVGFEEFDEPALLEQMRGQSLSSRFESPAYFKQLEAGEVVKQAVDIWFYPGRQPTARLGRSVLIPIRLGEDLLGLLTLYPKAGRAGYTKEEGLLAAAMAKLAALLIERERLQHNREEAWVRMQAAQEVMQQMDDFLGIASHELKTPLTSLQGNLQLARRQLSRLNIPQSFGKQATMSLSGLLDRAERQIKVQSRLINDLLDVSRIQANRLELSPALVDLSQIVQEAVESQHNLVPARSLEVEVPSQEVQVFADAERIGQVLNNYLSNALKYSEPDCPVKVYVLQAGNMARVEVIDEGPGLLFDQQAHIWQRFYRVPGIEVKSGSGVGLGLGLHICKTIIERQAGEIGVESAPGQGSTFWFTLPLAEPVQDVVE
jgi:signal transduction histidine kinase